MAIRDILEIGHPLLRTAASPVELQNLNSPAVQGLIDDLIDTMRDANGAGLAANQVGEPLQVCVLEVSDNPRYPYKPTIPLTVLINPVLEVVGSETFENYEGCLSVPNLRGLVPRHTQIRVRALDRRGDAIDAEVSGLTAATYQHEVDHLRGVLFVDAVADTASLCTWNEFELRHKDAFVARARALVSRYGG
jgi:peptide deformylase